MANYDIFNGDADGISALLQLRLAGPRKASLVTGVKRDINLLGRVLAKAGDHLTVLDISMRTNQAGLKRALGKGAYVFYVDHHHAGHIPTHENLFAVIDTRPAMCTSLLVNKCLKGQYADWAIVGAFGDNMDKAATQLAEAKGYTPKQILQLKQFGRMINYNGYGRDISDLHFAPDALYMRLLAYKCPFECIENDTDILQILYLGFEADMALANAANWIKPNVALLEDAPWSRRISGSFGNALANENPTRAHAILTHNAKGGYLVSVRAPLINPKGADTLCLQFSTGGGRAGAAGINHLPKKQLDRFLKAFEDL